MDQEIIGIGSYFIGFILCFILLYLNYKSEIKKYRAIEHPGQRPVESPKWDEDKAGFVSLFWPAFFVFVIFTILSTSLGKLFIKQ